MQCAHKSLSNSPGAPEQKQNLEANLCSNKGGQKVGKTGLFAGLSWWNDALRYREQKKPEDINMIICINGSQGIEIVKRKNKKGGNM